MKIYTDDEMKKLIEDGVVHPSQIDWDEDEEYTEDDYPFSDICPSCMLRYVHDFPACLEHCPYT